MFSVFYTIGMVVLWVFNLLNGTGIGNTYQTTDIISGIILVITLAYLAAQFLWEGDLAISHRYFYIIIPMALVFGGVSLLNGHRFAGLEGFWVYLLVFLLSKTRPNANALRMTAIAYGVLGLAILYIYNYMDALDGWNGNSIAMIGLFSFLVFTIPFYGMKGWLSYIAMPLVGAAYVFLIWPTESRSCIIVVIITLLLVLRILPVDKFLESSSAIVVVLLVPVFVAVFVCLFSLFGDTTGLAEWNAEVFGKDLFNGRDEIWMDGFRRIFQAPLFGTGKIDSGYWHNSAMACLTAFGIVGYALWLRMFYVILREGQPFSSDVCVRGSMVAFLILYCQQSVELGIFAQAPSLLPYVILGILLGRVNYLRRKRRCLQ